MSESLMTLRCIFENVDDSILMLALDEAGGDLQRAIDATLEMTSGGPPAAATLVSPAPLPTSKPTAEKPMPKGLTQEEQDEALARALQEQYISSVSEGVDDDAEYARRLQEEEQDRRYARGPSSRVNNGLDLSDDEDDEEESGVEGSDFLANFLQLTTKDGGMIASGVLDQFKGTIQNLVDENLRSLNLPGAEEDGEGFAYSVGGISFENIEINPDKITIVPVFPGSGLASLTPPESPEAAARTQPSSPADLSFQLTLDEINTTINKFPWSFKKKTFPKFKDSGNAKAKINGIKIQVLLKVVSNPRTLASIRVMDTKVTIKKTDLKISGAKVSIVYNMLLSLFSGKIKKMIEVAITNAVTEALSNA